MDNSNIKVYLGISFALIVLLILIIVIPFSKKSPAKNNNTNSTGQPFPTSIETNSTDSTDSTDSTAIPADFTGVAEEELPPQVLDTSLQKKDLRQKAPLELSAFTIDFDYSQDKFVVELRVPKDQARQEFESWRTANYPGLGSEQFILK